MRYHTTDGGDAVTIHDDDGDDAGFPEGDESGDNAGRGRPGEHAHSLCRQRTKQTHAHGGTSPPDGLLEISPAQKRPLPDGPEGPAAPRPSPAGPLPLDLGVVAYAA